jgi:uncharacterized phage-associated protein
MQNHQKHKHCLNDEILRQAKAKNISITPMKLVYITHGWFLAIKNRNLFNERIEAWQYEPVIPDLYHATKQFGRNEIPLNLVDDNFDNGVDTDTKDFIKDVLNKYGHFDAFALSSLTHESGTPWDIIYNNYYSDSEIPDELIRSHYLQRL